MEALLSQRYECEDFKVEFEVIPVANINYPIDKRQEEIYQSLNSIDEQLALIRQKIEKINVDINKLTCHADGLDYLVAVASGIIVGIIDSVWVGEFSIERANDWGNKKVNDFVVKIAQSQGYKGNDLEGAISTLEKKYRLSSDSVTSQFGGGLQHHLRDFSHHPTPVGLIFSLLTQFTGKAYGTDTNGAFIAVNITNKTYIGKNIPQKLLFGVIYWFFHMVSDIAGSNASAGAGTGLPGPLVSLLKELSVLPFFKNVKIDDTQFSVWISKLFNGTLLAKRDENGNIIEKVKFDLRTEIGVAHELGRQAIPVMINECIVRGFYFIRRFYFELRDHNITSISELKNININNVLPIKNRTIIRMLTISSGTFTAIDLTDAAIRAAVKSEGSLPAFFTTMILRVNFVGVGRFAIAIGTDVGMGISRTKLRNEVIRLHTKQIALLNVKVFYKQADMWISAESANDSIEAAYNMIEKTATLFIESLNEINYNLNKIDQYIPDIKEKNPGLLNEIDELLTWG